MSTALVVVIRVLMNVHMYRLTLGLCAALCWSITFKWERTEALDNH